MPHNNAGQKYNEDTWLTDDPHLDAYAKSKGLAEKVCFGWARLFLVQICVLCRAPKLIKEGTAADIVHWHLYLSQYKSVPFRNYHFEFSN